MKDQVKLLHTSGKHYKFWSYSINQDHTVVCTWGRLGTKGQSKTYTHHSRWDAEEYASGKLSEKFRKGYKEVDQESWELEHLRGEIVGAGAKIKNLGFVKEEGPHWIFVGAEEMYNPKYVPQVFCELELTGNRGSHALMIDVDDVYEVEVYSRSRSFNHDTNQRQLNAFRLINQKKITTTGDKQLQKIVDKAPGIVSSLIR